MNYSYDLKEIGKYYNIYEDLLEHYQNIFPNFIRSCSPSIRGLNISTIASPMRFSVLVVPIDHFPTIFKKSSSFAVDWYIGHQVPPTMWRYARPYHILTQ